MSRNIVPRTNKGADLGTEAKNWNRLYADAVILRGRDLQALLDGKTDIETLTAKGDLYVATDAGVITRLPAGIDGYVLKSDSSATEGLIWGPAGARQELTGNLTVSVGDNGDFSTINAALENIVALYYPKYIQGGNCPRVTINLLSGFVMSEQVLVESLDLSWITISGVDPETIINRGALTKHFGLGYAAFAVNTGGFLPIIDQLFSMDTSGISDNRVGVVATNNSRAIINPNCGIKNVPYSSIFAVNNSTISAESANASGASAYNIYATGNSTINAQGANASGAGARGIYAVNNSTINAESANASGAGDCGIYAINGSIINAPGADASGAGVHGIYAEGGSIINAFGANASGAGGKDISVYNGSIVNANSATANTLEQTPNVVTSHGVIFMA